MRDGCEIGAGQGKPALARAPTCFCSTVMTEGRAEPVSVELSSVFYHQD